MKTPNTNALLRLLAYVKHHPYPKDKSLEELENYAAIALYYAELKAFNSRDIEKYIDTVNKYKES